MTTFLWSSLSESSTFIPVYRTKQLLKCVNCVAVVLLIAKTYSLGHCANLEQSSWINIIENDILLLENRWFFALQESLYWNKDVISITVKKQLPPHSNTDNPLYIKKTPQQPTRKNRDFLHLSTMKEQTFQISLKDVDSGQSMQ